MSKGHRQPAPPAPRRKSLRPGIGAALGILAIALVGAGLGVRASLTEARFKEAKFSHPIHEPAPARPASQTAGDATTARRDLAPAPPRSAAPGRPTDVEDWARQHPSDALIWALGAPNGPERSVVVENICLRLAQTAPATAAEIADALGADGYVLDNIVQQWAEHDVAAAQAYALSRPPSIDRDRLLSRVVLVESRTNPRAAARSVAELISPGEIQDEAALAVVHQWALRDNPSARAWIERFPEGRLRDRALMEMTPAVAGRMR